MRAGRLGVMVLAGAAWASIGMADDLVFQAAGEAQTVAPLVAGSPVNYVLDDGSAENSIGLNNTTTVTATQFLWFNRFDILASDLPLRVDQVQVFWTGTGSNPTVPGNAVSLHVYSDADNTPTNGATHVVTQTGNVGVVASAFDVFNITSAPAIPSGVNLLIGVVDRWVTSGVSGSTFPAAIDQTAPNNVRSWVASYTADPPNPPTIPSTGLFGTIDSFGLPGDWLVRATGTVVPVELMGVTIE
ncbi:MAG TPA: hypothetical protein VFQ51_04170 [Vicinamibacteria bacterium]|nr:hypothetical protein [Vicinamibacteria bacterium]